MPIQQNMAFRWIVPAIYIGLFSVYVNADTVVMEKQSTGFSIDGNRGISQENQQVYLWNTSLTNVNQQWIEVSYGNNYYAYQKNKTSLCLDGGDGGSRHQAVLLVECDSTNQNQQWLKVSTGGNAYRLAKRNAQDYSIDGSSTAVDGQEIFLWDSNSNNINQRWEFTVTELSANVAVEEPPERNVWTLEASNNQADLSNAIDGSTITRWTTKEAQNTRQWLTIDLSRESIFNTITLDSDRSLNDYPRGYAAYISDDGSNWGSAIATGNDSDSTTDIVFDEVSARYIQIRQTGSTNRYWWSIHDLSVSLKENINTPSNWTVDSLTDLRDAIESSNQEIVMKPGNYNITDLPSNSRNLLFSGSNNTIDLTGVYVDVPVGATTQDSYIVVDGSNNTIIGGTFEDTYASGLVNVTDFERYNQDRNTLAYGLRGDAVMSIYGDDNTVDGIKLTIRGSFPYGYGSLFGIGAGSTFGLSKRCGILIRAHGTTIDNSELQQRSFCHGIYMQSPADNTTIRNTLVEGIVRESNDMLSEGNGSLPSLNDYLTVDGDPILADEVHSLSEDGIRSYNSTGSVVVENSIVKKMRGGIRLYLASSATVSNSTALDCGDTNFNMPRGGTIINAIGNFTNGPLSDFRLSRSNQNLEITILPSPNAIGAHNIADVLGNSHDIVFHRADGPEDSDETRAIVVSGNNSTIRNETEYRIILTSGTSGNTIISAGDVTDNGSNRVSRIDLEL